MAKAFLLKYRRLIASGDTFVLLINKISRIKMRVKENNKIVKACGFLAPFMFLLLDLPSLASSDRILHQQLEARQAGGRTP